MHFASKHYKNGAIFYLGDTQIKESLHFTLSFQNYIKSQVTHFTLLTHFTPLYPIYDIGVVGYEYELDNITLQPRVKRLGDIDVNSSRIFKKKYFYNKTHWFFTADSEKKMQDFT